VSFKNITVSGGNFSYGGGIYLEKAALTLDEGTVITGNTNESPGKGGGGIYAEDSVLTMKAGSLVKGNLSDARDGGILAGYSTLTLIRGRISGNHTDNVEGGIAAGNSTF
jgi:hypothetical protein